MPSYQKSSEASILRDLRKISTKFLPHVSFDALSKNDIEHLVSSHRKSEKINFSARKQLLGFIGIRSKIGINVTSLEVIPR